MSEKGQNQTFRMLAAMSALGRKADIDGPLCNALAVVAATVILTPVVIFAITLIFV